MLRGDKKAISCGFPRPTSKECRPWWVHTATPFVHTPPQPEQQPAAREAHFTTPPWPRRHRRVHVDLVCPLCPKDTPVTRRHVTGSEGPGRHTHKDQQDSPLKPVTVPLSFPNPQLPIPVHFLAQAAYPGAKFSCHHS